MKTSYYKGEGNVAWLPKELVDRGYYVVKESVMTFLKKDGRTMRTWWTGTLEPRTVRAVCMNLAMKELAEFQQMKRSRRNFREDGRVV